VFKFSVYLAVPIFMTLAIAGSPKNLETLIKNVRGLPPLVLLRGDPVRSSSLVGMLVSTN